MNCQEVLSLLYDVLDKEASKVDTEEIKKHLNGCHHCLERYRLEGALHDFVLERARSMPSTERLESLKTRILATIDTISEADVKPAKKKSANLLTVGLSLAASVVVIGGVYLLSSEIYRHQEKYMALESSHWIAESEFQSGSFAHVAPAAATVSSELHYQVSQSVSGFQLSSGREEMFGGVAASHFLYTNGKKFVSVFILPARSYHVPDDLLESKVVRGDHVLYDHNCRGCRLVYHVVGEALVVTATTERDVELLDFIPGHSVI